LRLESDAERVQMVTIHTSTSWNTVDSACLPVDGALLRQHGTSAATPTTPRCDLNDLEQLDDAPQPCPTLRRSYA
jgi:hypothetical protein